MGKGWRSQLYPRIAEASIIDHVETSSEDREISCKCSGRSAWPKSGEGTHPHLVLKSDRY